MFWDKIGGGHWATSGMREPVQSYTTQRMTHVSAIEEGVSFRRWLSYLIQVEPTGMPAAATDGKLICLFGGMLRAASKDPVAKL